MNINNLNVYDITKRLSLPESAALVKLEAALMQGASEYCEKTGYQMIPIPHITRATGACENFDTLFKTDMFSEAAYLNQTGQLLLEAFMDRFNKTYCVGPSFRKENKADPRHLAEFTLFEIEVANMNLDELQQEVSNIVASMMAKVKSDCFGDLLQLLGMSIEELLAHFDNLLPEKIKSNNSYPTYGSYKSITYRDALDQLPEFNLNFGDDLKAQHEQRLVELNDLRPLFVTHYPKEIKFFNMRENREDNTVVNSMDLLMPVSGEAVGAAEREEDHERLRKRLDESDMLRLLKNAIKDECGFEDYTDTELHSEALSRFDWYMNIIEAHPIEHAGCGIGVSRIAQSILGVDDIRQAVAFPINRETLF